MADNIQLDAATSTTGAVLATDEVGSAHYQYVKTTFGGDGTASIVTSTNGLPITVVDSTVAVTGSGNFTVTQATATAMNVTVGNSSLAVTQATATNLNATVSGAVTVTNATASNLNADVTINGNATVIQSTGSNLNARVSLNGGDAIATPGSAAVAKCVQLAGSDGTNAQTIKTATNGEVKVQGSGNFAVTQATATNLNATVSGTITAQQATATAFNVTVGGQPALDRTTDNIGVALQTDALLSDTTVLTPKFETIDDATSGDNTIVAAVAGKKIRVVACFMISAGTVNARFESGAGGTALTGQMNLVANSGFTLPFNPLGWFETASNTLLNLELSANVSVDGCLVYVEV